MPDFRVRHDSGHGAKRRVHFGTDVTYISINQIPDPVEGQFEGDCPGYQHIGFVVEDVDALRARILLLERCAKKFWFRYRARTLHARRFVVNTRNLS